MKTLVVLISHIFNDFVADRYNDLKCSLLDDYDLILLHPNDYDETYFIEHDINHLKIDAPKNHLDPRNWGLPDTGKIYTKVFENIHQYDYYWFIEYDVVINTNRKDKFSELFSYFNDKDFDIVCDHLYSYTNNKWYNNRYPWHQISKDYRAIRELKLKKKDVWFGFYTITRLSKNMLLIYRDNPLYQLMFFEYGLTTLAKKEKAKICSLNNLFTSEIDVYDDFEDHEKINNGSNSWRCKRWEHIKNYPEGYIVHPIKNYD